MENNQSAHDPIVVVKDDAASKKPAFFKRIQAPFSKLSLPNKKIAGALVALLLVFGVGVGVFLAQRQTQLRPRASENGVDLKLTPPAVSAALNQEFDLDLVIDAKQASASGAQVKLTFDASKLQLVSTTLKDYFSVVLSPVNATANSVEFVVGTSTPKTGTGTLATLKFKALANGAATVAFDQNNTIVTVTNLNDNQAGDLTPSEITIGGAAVSPSPVVGAGGFSPDTAGTLVTGLRGYWKMEEASGNLVDSVSSLALSPIETVTYNQTGKVAKAVGSTGAGKFQCTDAVCGGTTKLDPSAATGISFGGWVYPKAYATVQTYVVGKSALNNQKTGYWLMYGPNGNVRVEMGNSSCDNDSALGFQTAVTAPLNQWTHLMATVTAQNPGIVKIYKNGALVYTSPASAYYCDTDGAFSIAGSNGSGLSTNHSQLVDEIGVWAKPLTAAEVTNLYNGGNGNTYSAGVVVTNPETSLTIEAPATAAVDSTFIAEVKARTDKQESNLFVSKITFPANLLEVTSVDTTGSFVTSWAEKFYDNTTGQISLVGGVPNPGYKTTGTAMTAAKITFKVKAAGTANLDLTAESQIFSNATNTNIIEKTTDDSITLTGDGTTPSPSPVVSPSPSPVPSPSANASVNCLTLKGDGNGDCVVNLTDLSIMLSNFSATNPVPAGKQLLDFNDDNRINSFDFSAMGDKLFQLQVIRRQT